MSNSLRRIIAGNKIKGKGASYIEDEIDDILLHKRQSKPLHSAKYDILELKKKMQNADRYLPFEKEEIRPTSIENRRSSLEDKFKKEDIMDELIDVLEEWLDTNLEHIVNKSVSKAMNNKMKYYDSSYYRNDDELYDDRHNNDLLNRSYRSSKPRNKLNKIKKSVSDNRKTSLKSSGSLRTRRRVRIRR